MTVPPPLDSATALARTPIFARLGRLDLARLAGELEEVRFAAGQVIVREGDPGDAFYVVNAGQVRVVTEAETPDATPVVLLGPGEGFGEMALLAGSPRTATVVAHTDVTVWRLSRARFEALLGRERPIAQSIERSLSHRLAATTHEVGALRRVGHALAARALGGLSPAALRLLASLVVRPRWPVPVLTAACDGTATAAALAELDEVPGLLERAGEQVAVDRTLLGLGHPSLPEADAAWLRAAAQAFRAAGDLVGAVDLALEAAAADEAARHLAEAGEGMLASLSVTDLDRWLARAGAAASPLTERLAAVRAELTRRQAAPPSPASTEVRAARGRLGRLSGRIGIPQLLGTSGAIALFVLGGVLPVPAGLDRPGLVALGAIMATVPLLVTDVLPDYVIMLLLTVALVVPGLVPASDVLAGFATPAWLMILTLLAVGVAISRSGLVFRLVLLSLERLPPSFMAQSLVLAATGVLMTAGITSGATRIALGVPIARGMADAMGFGRQSRGSIAIGLLTFFTSLQMGTLFLTGTFTGLVVHDLLPPAAKAQITWWRWFFVALPPFVIMFAAFYAWLLLAFRPQQEARVNLGAVRFQKALLGPLTRNELWSAVVLLVLVVGFATRDLHGIAPAWLAAILFLVLFVVGVLDDSALQAGGALGLLLYSGVILSLGNVFTTLHIDTWLTSLVRGGMPGMVANPYGFVLVVALVAFVLHFFVPWMTACTLIALVTMPLAEGLGFHPFIPVLVALVAGDHTMVPYVNSGFAMLYFASEGELFSRQQARLTLVLESLVRVVALLASVPLWRLLGLM